MIFTAFANYKIAEYSTTQYNTAEYSTVDYWYVVSTLQGVPHNERNGIKPLDSLSPPFTLFLCSVNLFNGYLSWI